MYGKVTIERESVGLSSTEDLTVNTIMSILYIHHTSALQPVPCRTGVCDTLHPIPAEDVPLCDDDERRANTFCHTPRATRETKNKARFCGNGMGFCWRELSTYLRICICAVCTAHCRGLR